MTKNPVTLPLERDSLTRLRTLSYLSLLNMSIYRFIQSLPLDDPKSRISWQCPLKLITILRSWPSFLLLFLLRNSTEKFLKSAISFNKRFLYCTVLYFTGFPKITKLRLVCTSPPEKPGQFKNLNYIHLATQKKN